MSVGVRRQAGATVVCASRSPMRRRGDLLAARAMRPTR